MIDEVFREVQAEMIKELEKKIEKIQGDLFFTEDLVEDYQRAEEKNIDLINLQRLTLRLNEKTIEKMAEYIAFQAPTAAICCGCLKMCDEEDDTLVQCIIKYFEEE